MKSELAKKLKSVLDEMSQEQFDLEWSAVTSLNLNGPSFTDAVEYFASMQNKMGSYELNSTVATEVIDVKNNYNLAA